MNSEEKSKLKVDIEKKIEEIKHRISVLKDLTKPIEPDDAIGRVSRMDAINNKSVNDAALRQKEKQLRALEDALDNIDDNKFGKCIKCGKDIPYGRILIMPESKKCVTCASR
jgi:DnaK suppressor protein